MGYMETYQEWILSDNIDNDTKAELLSLKGDLKEIEDRFYKNLEFGTGGLRAVIGAGINRLNKYTVRRITLGYANFLLKEFGQEAKNRGVVIAHDMRHKSDEFTLEAAQVLAASGIPTYLFKEITTTPELSFSVPHLNAIGGIVITASHNPPQYNGYKIYDESGCQAVPSLAEKIITEIDLITSYSDIVTASKNSKLINWLDDNIDKDFIEAEKLNMRNPEIVREMGEKMKILYTPLHGTGKKAIFRGLKEIGFQNIYTVEEQLVEDPDFKTVTSPNPEELSAFDMSLTVAKENDVDLIMGTDPDSDRVGVLVKVEDNKYQALNGNQVGSLLVYYLLSTDLTLQKKNNPYIANTIVTSSLGSAIAESFKVGTIATLTGFKFIGEQINLLEKNKTFIMGYEESYGYLVSSIARDKDAVGSAMMIAEMAAFYLKEGKNLVEQLNVLFDKYGYYKEELISKTLPGRDGMQEISNMMQRFRSLTDDELTLAGISELKDYSLGIDNLPASDVLKFIFDNESWVAIRPSGTEPKIKFYLGVKAANEKMANQNLFKLHDFINIGLT